MPITQFDILESIKRIAKGGEGSGNFGHEGRPGEVGGSGGGGGGKPSGDKPKPSDKPSGGDKPSGEKPTGTSDYQKIGSDIASRGAYSESVKWSTETGRERGMAIIQEDDGSYRFGFRSYDGNSNSVTVLAPIGSAGVYHTHPGKTKAIDSFSRDDLIPLMTGRDKIAIAQNAGAKGDTSWMAVRTKSVSNLNNSESTLWAKEGAKTRGANSNDYAANYFGGVLKGASDHGIDLYYGKLGGKMTKVSSVSDYKKVVLKK